ncbi:MAG: DUF1634 domain-containing protein [Candidatus Thermoplasmatota archaeon]|nr:DUF1634 domain-containing protein [Candidatus Thermoplasmatota archaeon]MCL5665235.1 DUF1634 domain-containing protein [Candidatus Thermoplasmatota archaeon]
MTQWTFENVVSRILKVGVILTISLILIGSAFIFIHDGANGYPLSKICDISGNTSDQLNSSSLAPSNIISGIAHLDGAYFITLGLWILVFTPISVVAVSLAEFIRKRNGRYIIMSSIVLFNLFFAMLVIAKYIK